MILFKSYWFYYSSTDKLFFDPKYNSVILEQYALSIGKPLFLSIPIGRPNPIIGQWIPREIRMRIIWIGQQSIK